MTQETPEETNRRLRVGVYPPLPTLRDSIPARRSASGPTVVLVLVAVIALLVVGLVTAVLFLAAG